ncbi:Inner membrane protein [Sulfitobacter noctilucicola]|uniref:Putative MAPEG superfamily protein n=1 Tax=Sulfitobacter noctilucicola TaxID=1342301 RepID=A0A7W6M826_9RHOB|nr:MAPEG family protein [Sulfitobacter noctilucicola]KIN64690.1 Inner membrane protein [Sulfitobacter noctilucicola]MBB4174161.1 putative MAPEG superfamily protein [Sulfitobacter noctilucicola]
MEAFAGYSHAIASLALWSLICLVLGGLSTRGRTAENRCACGQPKRDYSDVVYRRGRAFANAIEMSGPFIGTTIAAILIGVAPFWVNLLASVFVVSRIVMAIVHIGTENQPARSATWVIGWICVIVLALMTFRTALIG